MNFINDNNHVIVSIDGVNCLIDTGLPCSFSFDGNKKIRINGKEYTIYPGSHFGTNNTKESLSHLVTTRVDVFIGNDILKNGFTIDYNNSEIVFESRRGTEIFFVNRNDPFYLSTENATINGVISRYTIIDSGAFISYISNNLLNGAFDTGKIVEDYSPMLGKITSNVFEVDLGKNTMGSGSYTRRIKAGKLDQELEKKGITAVLALKDISSTGIVSFDGKAFNEVNN